MGGMGLFHEFFGGTLDFRPTVEIFLAQAIGGQFMGLFQTVKDALAKPQGGHYFHTVYQFVKNRLSILVAITPKKKAGKTEGSSRSSK